MLKSTVKNAIKNTDKAVLAGDKESAEKYLRLAIKSLDNAKVKGLVHKNKVDREKSRLTQKVNKMEVKQYFCFFFYFWCDIIKIERVGASNIVSYVQSAKNFKGNLSGAKSSKVNGSTPNVTRWKKNGKYIDICGSKNTGKIISYGRQ